MIFYLDCSGPLPWAEGEAGESKDEILREAWNISMPSTTVKEKDFYYNVEKFSHACNVEQVRMKCTICELSSEKVTSKGNG